MPAITLVAAATSLSSPTFVATKRFTTPIARTSKLRWLVPASFIQCDHDTSFLEYFQFHYIYGCCPAPFTLFIYPALAFNYFIPYGVYLTPNSDDLLIVQLFGNYGAGPFTQEVWCTRKLSHVS